MANHISVKFTRLLYQIRPLDFWGIFACEFHPSRIIVDKNEDKDNDYTRYMDYYNSEFIDYFYMFDNLDELRHLLTRPILDIHGIAEKQMEMYHQVRLKSLYQWSRLLDIPIKKLPARIIKE